MKKLGIFIIFLISLFSADAQNIWAPGNYYPPAPVPLTSTQRAVGVSTDVIAISLPAASIIGTAIAGDWEGLKQIGFTALLAGGSTLLLKYTIRELRPDHSSYNSFPSMHSTVSFASAAYLQRRYGWKFGAPAYALATYVAVGRVVGKRHHWWDCVAGAAIGAGSAYLFTTPWAKKHDFSMAPVASDEYFGLSTQFSF